MKKNVEFLIEDHGYKDNSSLTEYKFCHNTDYIKIECLKKPKKNINFVCVVKMVFSLNL